MSEKPSKSVTESPWTDWRQLTPARVALGRAGEGLPTDEVLRFGWAHAAARDAIHAALDTQSLEATLRNQGWNLLQVRSRAADRATYLRRPDLGRILDPADIERLKHWAAPQSDLCFVIGDGLSSVAIERHAASLLEALTQHLGGGIRDALLVIATQARVALADDIAALLKPRLVIMLIGERPGLSSPDSLGIYITHAPFTGRSDADRNCISNIRPEGLNYENASFRLAWLVREALRRQLTGVALKDESDSARLEGGATAEAPAFPRT